MPKEQKMSDLLIYPFDPTGNNPTNLIIGEEQAIEEINYKDFYVLVPELAPFYLENLLVQYNDGVNPTRTLIMGQDYVPVFPDVGLTRSVGIPLYGAIYLLGTKNTGIVEMQYQTIGGEHAVSRSKILEKLSEEIYNPRTVDWSNITGEPSCFRPLTHTEDISGIYGMGSLVAYINTLSELVSNSPAKEISYSVRNQFYPKNYKPIATSVIDSPILTTASTPTSITVNGSAFTVAFGTDTQVSASWQIATDSAFTNIVQNDINDSVNLNSYTFNGLNSASSYFIRALYTGKSGNNSPWSSVVIANTKAASVVIDAPVLNLSTTGTSVSAIGSAFTLASGIDTELSASWQIATDSAFTNIVQSYLNDTADLTSYTFNKLNYSTTYYVRAMYNGNSGASSPWSSVVNITTVAAPVTINAPVITLTTYRNEVTATGSPFSLSSGTDSQNAATWQIATDSAFTNIVQNDINDTIDLTSYTFTGLNYSTAYYVRAMYIGTSGSSSPWSNTASIGTAMAPVVNAPTVSLSVSGTSITATGSAFTLSSGIDTEASATWQIATDSAFTNIVQNDINDTIDLTSYTFSGLSYSTTYYVRAMYNGASGSSSPWSSTASIATGAAPIVIDAPTVSLSTSGTSITATGSAFTLSSGIDTEASADWQIATDSAFTNIVQTDSNDTVNLTSYTFSGLSYSTTYYVRAMYNGASGSSSPWSSTASIATGAAPVLGIAVFGGGYNGTTTISNTSIYTYSTNTATLGNNFAYSSDGLAAISNSAIGVFGGGVYSNAYGSSPISTTSIYTYSSNATTLGGDLSYIIYASAASGNSSLGVFGGGVNTAVNTGAVPVSMTSIYTYSSNTAITGGNLSYAALSLGAAGNSTVAIFAGGYSSINLNANNLSFTSIYTYSSNSAVAGTNLNTVGYGAGASTPTLCVFSNASNTTVYTYSSNSFISGGNLSISNNGQVSSSNSIVGVFGGGYMGSSVLSTTSVYTYSTNTAVNGGNLSYACDVLAACGPNPGVNS